MDTITRIISYIIVFLIFGRVYKAINGNVPTDTMYAKYTIQSVRNA